MTMFKKSKVGLVSLLTLLGAAACETHEEGEVSASAAEAHHHDEHEGEEAPADDHHTDDHAVEGQAAALYAAETPASFEDLPEGVNAVQHEMRLLNEAMHTTLTLIANNQLGGIPALIHRVHPAKELTHSAIEAGAYLPPKNPERIEAFVEMDEVFHDDLRELLRAAKADDLQRATAAYGELVQGCTNCHTAFRY